MENAAAQQFDDLIARRLVAKAQGDELQPVGETPQPAPAEKPPFSKVEFVKLEKNLASLGFFTPSSKRVRTESSKTINFTKVIDGKRVEARATIAATALYGLPITADQDKYLALQKIITDLQQRTGRVQNPVGFTSAELLKVLGQYRDSGKNYRDVEEWLNVMTSTTIVSEGAVFLAGQRRWVQDRFHVFDRALSVGKTLPDGTVADRNFVWLSEWQLENINSNHQLPIELDTYRRLKNHIAKALVPLLQIWLYASRNDSEFGKRYQDVCEILNLRRYAQPSRIKEQLGPSLDELQAHGYLAAWSVEETMERKTYKVVFRHGEKFRSDRRRRLNAVEDARAISAPASPAAPPEEAGDERAAALIARGVSPMQARRLLAAVPAAQPVIDQLEWGDDQVAERPGKIRNPAGFYVSLIRDNVSVPATFESSRERKERAAVGEASREERDEQTRLKNAYLTYQGEEVEKHLAAMAPDALQALLARERDKLVTEFRNLRHFSDEQLLKLARVRLVGEIATQLPLLTFPAFCNQQKAGDGATPTA